MGGSSLCERRVQTYTRTYRIRKKRSDFNFRAIRTTIESRGTLVFLFRTFFQTPDVEVLYRIGASKLRIAIKKRQKKGTVKIRGRTYSRSTEYTSVRFQNGKTFCWSVHANIIHRVSYTCVGHWKWRFTALADCNSVVTENPLSKCT